MKRALLAISLSLCAAAVQAQRLPSAADQTAALRDYAIKVLPRCPSGVVTLEAVQGAGPSNFKAYVATVRSDDQYCGTQKYLLYSPKSQQILLGSVIPIPTDGRPTAVRLTEKSTQLLGKTVKATIAPFPLPDGIKAVSINRDTQYGSFSYAGFIDQSEQFLIVGFRGSLLTDPAKTLARCARRRQRREARHAARRRSSSSPISSAPPAPARTRSSSRCIRRTSAR
jgi:hypothetical protein